MASDLRLYDSTLTELTAANLLTFAGLVQGGRSTTTVLYAINDKGVAGADTATNRQLSVLERRSGETDWLASGRALTNGRWVEARITEGYGGLDAEVTGWTPIGASSSLPLPSMASGKGVKIELSIVLPIDAAGDDLELYFQANRQITVALPKGISEASGDGVYLGIGDDSASQLLTAGNVIQNPGGADDQVSIPALGWISAGVAHANAAQLYQLDATDGDAAALAAGEGYYARIYVDGSGSIQAVKGSKAALPLGPSNEPAAPPGHELALIARDDTGVIQDADITQRWQLDAGLYSSTGLNVTLGPSEGLVSGRWWVHQEPEAVALTANATNTIWRLPDGAPQVLTGSTVPSAGGLALWEMVTDGSGVTSAKRLAPWLGRWRWITMEIPGSLAVNAAAYSQWPAESAGIVPPVTGSVVVQLLGASGSSGSTVVDVQSGTPGALTTLYGTLPKATIASADTLSADSIVDTVIGGRHLLRAIVTTAVTGTAPTGALISVQVF